MVGGKNDHLSAGTGFLFVYRSENNNQVLFQIGTLVHLFGKYLVNSVGAGRGSRHLGVYVRASVSCVITDNLVDFKIIFNLLYN